MTEHRCPLVSDGQGMKPISEGSTPAVFAAACICVTAHDPSHIAEILPVASNPFEFSQFVVVGSGSLSLSCTMLYSSESIWKRSLPELHGAVSVDRLSLAAAAQLGDPTAPCHELKGQPSL